MYLIDITLGLSICWTRYNKRVSASIMVVVILTSMTSTKDKNAKSMKSTSFTADLLN